MAITAISAAWTNNPRIINIETSDDLITITTPGYLIAQQANIEAIQNGMFQWQYDDYCLISGSNFEGFFNVDFTTNFRFIQASSNLISSTTPISSSEIEAMYDTPLLIVPNYGLLSVVLVQNAWVEFDYGGTQYTGGGATGLQYGDTAAKAGLAASTTIAGATIDAYTANEGFLLTGEATGPLAEMVNLGIYLSNDTAPFATGDSTMNLNIVYRVVNTADA